MILTRKLKILVVEDDIILREVVTNILRRDGHRVYDAKSALVALRILDDHKFDLILTDIMMPMMNGIEFLRKLKGDPCYKQIPVLMMSANTSKETVQDALALGIVGYMVKPISADDLHKKINQVADFIPPIMEDIRFTTSRLGVNIIKFRELLKKFAINALEQSDSMNKALDQGQLNQFLQAAQNLSVTADSMGAIGVREAAKIAIQEVPSRDVIDRQKFLGNINSEIKRLEEILPEITLTTF